MYREPALRLAACVRARIPPTVRERCEAGSLDRRLRLRGRSVRAENRVYRQTVDWYSLAVSRAHGGDIS